MTLSAGSPLGPYEIVPVLGAGGMGEVYRARDTRLGRDVAIKVLPPAFSSDPERLARFEQDARAAAALNHPNILDVFDIGTHAGAPYIVSELLEGETLREKIHGLPARKAIDYAIQIAHGLGAAHEKGIVHRDLKPENIFVAAGGRVKVLDFGLAKLMEPEIAPAGASLLPTTPPQTTPGMVLGTAGYMSPEQVRGREADPRSDIFAFGAILYEMLAGRRAFGGETSIDTMSAILKEDPPRIDASRHVPPGMARIVERCLEKDPAARFKSADDLAFALEALSGSTTTALPVHPSHRRRFAAAAGTIAVVALIGLAFALGQRMGTAAPRDEIAFHTLTFEPQAIFNARFAPDGETVIFSAALEGNSPELFASRVNAIAPQPIGTRTHLLSVSSRGELAVLIDPAFIQHRLFRGTLARMPIDGAPRPWMENVREADWSPDGSTLAIIRDDGRTDTLEYPIGTVLYQASGYLSDLRVSPDGARVAFFEHPVRYDDRGWLKVADRQSNVRTLAGEYWGQEGIAWAPDGRTIFYSAGEAGWDSFYPRAVGASGSAVSRAALPNAGGVFVHDVSPAGRWSWVESTTTSVPGHNCREELRNGSFRGSEGSAVPSNCHRTGS